MADGRTPAGAARRHRVTAFVCAGVVAGMVGLAYAAVPLYRIFCQVTGYGGTPQIAAAAPQGTEGREITIRFDANTAAALPWEFAPVERSVKVRLGETQLAFFHAANHSSERITGTATFNVVPVIAGAYFNKIDCFCFTEQTLGPSAEADLPVSFYVDPAIDDDPDIAGIGTITLSYTFFRDETPDEALDGADATGEAKVN